MHCLSHGGSPVLVGAAGHAHSEAMPVGFIEHAGQRILAMDFAGVRGEDAILLQIAQAKGFVAGLPKRGDLLTLVDLSGIRFNPKILAAFRALNRHDKPWQRAVAVCGLKGMGLTVFRAQNLLMANPMRGFETRSEALAWLVGEGVRKGGGR